MIRRNPSKRFFRNVLERHGRPERVVIDGSQTKTGGDCLLRCREPTAGPLAARPDDIFDFGRVYPERQELSEADQKRMDELTAVFDDLADQIEADEDAKDARAS